MADHKKVNERCSPTAHSTPIVSFVSPHFAYEERSLFAHFKVPKKIKPKTDTAMGSCCLEHQWPSYAEDR